MAAVLSAERLEVSVDGLTLSPDPEERPGAEGAPLLPPPLPPPSPPGAGRGPSAAGRPAEPGAAAGGAAEEARCLERRWGFGLEELHGLALRFFKGEPAAPPAPGARPGPARPCGGPGGAGPSHPRRAPSLAAPELRPCPLGRWVTAPTAWGLGSAVRGPPPRGDRAFSLMWLLGFPGAGMVA